MSEMRGTSPAPNASSAVVSRPDWLWQDCRPPLGRDEMVQQISGAIREKTAFHLYGPAGRGKATLTAYLAQEYVNQGGRVLWLPVGHQPLAALLCQVARHYRDDPRAQAALKARDSGQNPGQQRAAEQPGPLPAGAATAPGAGRRGRTGDAGPLARRNRRRPAHPQFR